MTSISDPLRQTRRAETPAESNKYFVALYRSFAALGAGLEAREHTAQVDPEERKERENRFKSADLKLLFCSPTMELGVDISQLNVVNLRNVPPTPANYAQRGGRAGRSGQPALIYTYCSGFSAHSQLPIRHDGRIIGVFSWKSLGKRAADLRATKLQVVDLAVQDCMESPMFIGPEVYIDTATDWSDLDYVLVGSPEGLIGILCVADVFGRLNDFAEAFVLLYEVEHEVRDLITDMTTPESLADMISKMTTPPAASLPNELVELIAKAPNHERINELLVESLRRSPTRSPRLLAEFTFDQYRALITAKNNWHMFEPAIGTLREIVDADFKEIAGLRNVVFHFRRGVSPKDTDRLRRFRDSLRFGRDMLKRRRATTTAKSVAPQAS